MKRPLAPLPFSLLLIVLLPAAWPLAARGQAAEDRPTNNFRRMDLQVRPHGRLLADGTGGPSYVESGSYSSAGAEKPQIAGVRVGFAGAYKAGYWTPVEVLLRGGRQEAAVRVAVTVPDGDGVPSRVAQSPEQAVRIAPGQSRSVQLHVRFGRAQGSLTVDLYAGQELLESKTWRPAPGTRPPCSPLPCWPSSRCL